MSYIVQIKAEFRDCDQQLEKEIKLLSFPARPITPEPGLWQLFVDNLYDLDEWAANLSDNVLMKLILPWYTFDMTPTYNRVPQIRWVNPKGFYVHEHKELAGAYPKADGYYYLDYPQDPWVLQTYLAHKEWTYTKIDALKRLGIIADVMN